MRAVWLLAFTAFAAVIGFLGPSWLVQQHLAAYLQERLEATGGISVRAIASLPALIRRRVERVEVAAEGVRIGDVRAERLSVSLRGVSVATGSGGAVALTGVDSGTVELSIGQRDLERYLRGRDVGAPSVAIDAAGVTATGEVRIGPVLARARVRGQFVAVERTELYFHPEALEVGGVALPRPLAAGIFGAATQPIVSLRALPVPVAIERITPSPGRITISARVGTLAP